MRTTAILIEAVLSAFRRSLRLGRNPKADGSEAGKSQTVTKPVMRRCKYS